jgi:hypothetical protein
MNGLKSNLRPVLRCRHVVTHYRKNNYLNKSCIFFEDLLPQTVLEPRVKWLSCHLRIRNFPMPHVGVIYERELRGA